MTAILRYIRIKVQTYGATRLEKSILNPKKLTGNNASNAIIRINTSNAAVTVIRQTPTTLVIDMEDGKSMEANQVIVCIPPQLASRRIAFSRELLSVVRQILPTVQTWMAGAVKFTLEYAEPFWRTEGYSGMLYSHAGIVTEMYDHTNAEGTRFGFTGFLNGGAASYDRETRKEFVLRQLSELFGERMLRPTAYQDKVWDDIFLTDSASLVQRPHQNNGHSALQIPYMNGKLYFCGTETSTVFPGYMEGAIAAAKSVMAKLQIAPV